MSASTEPGTQTRETRWKRVRRRLSPLFAAAIVGLAVWLLFRTLRGYSYEEIVASIAAIPLSRLGFAGLFAAGSYFCLTWSDYLATRFVEHDIPYPHVALTSFLALSLGHNIGFAALSSGAIRYRIYTRWGMSAVEVAKVIMFCGLTVIFGLMLLAGLAFMLQSDLTREVTGLGQGATFGLGLTCLVVSVCYPLAASVFRGSYRIRGRTIELPRPSLAGAQLVVGVVNFALVGACLHQTMIAVADVPYVSAAVAYVLANLGILITHVPGGLGVIEATVSAAIPHSGLIGALLVFRFVYFLVPLALGGTGFLVTEAVFRRHDRRAARNREP